MKHALVLLFGIFLISSCGDTNGPAEPEVAAPDKSVIALDHVNFPLQFKAHEKYTSNASPELRMNNTTGVFEISIGDKIQFDIIGDSISIASFKEELLHDQLFTYKFYDEADDNLIYQAVLPTGEGFFYHYAALKNINGNYYFVRSREGNEYTLSNVKDIREVVNTLEALK
ncbi:MAG: hypothetical protein HKN32_02215 [Flavobacteriales bacterium]|nr:hypothetical protein [Flavobacteriales bacterium]